jgi:hypothetical protein
MKLLIPFVPALVCAAPLSAQCAGYGLSVSTVAPACSASGAPHSTLALALQPSPSLSQPCKLICTLDAPAYCCNIYIAARVLAFGANSASLPLPGGCKLLVDPLLLAAFPAPSGGTKSELAFGLPALPSLVGLTLLTQAGVVRFDTLAFATYVDTTQALKFTLTP